MYDNQDEVISIEDVTTENIEVVDNNTNNKNDGTENAIVEDTESVSKKNSRRKSNNQIKKCKVIEYVKKTRTLRLLFDNYGIEIKDVDEPTTDTVDVKYVGKIGSPNFTFTLM